MHAGLLERKTAQEEPAKQIGEERVDRDRAKATLGASVPLDGPLEVRKSLSRGRARVRAQHCWRGISTLLMVCTRARH